MNKNRAKRLLLGTVAAGLMLPTAVAVAGDCEIGIIDMKYIVDNSTKFKSMREDLQKKFDEDHKKALAVQTDLKGLYEKMNKNRSTMTDDELKQIRTEVQGKQAELAKLQTTFQKELMKAQSDLYDTFISEVRKEAADVADDKDFDYVLVKSATMVTPRGSDITKEVLDELD